MSSLPKKILLKIFLLSLFCSSGYVHAQASFTLSSQVCLGDTVKVTANTGTLAAIAFQWSSLNTGPLFTTANVSVTSIIFPAAGVYTIQLNINSGTESSNALQTVTVHAPPTISITASKPFLCAGQDATLTASGALNYVWTPTVGLYFFSNSSAYISPLVPVSYTISGTDNLGCTGTTAYTMNVYDYPTLIVLASSTSVCAGFSSTLTANGASNYSWTGSSFSSSVNQTTLLAGPGSYTLLGANGGCKDSTTLYIGTAPPITVNINASRNTICRNDGDSIVPVTLNASGASNYIWSPYDPSRMSYSLGVTTAVSPSTTTCYTVTGSTDICADAEELCINVTTCTALPEIKNELSVKVFPDPANEKLFIHTKGREDYSIKLYSITGVLVINEKGHASENQPGEIELAFLVPGMYLVQLIQNNRVIKTTRFLKN